MNIDKLKRFEYLNLDVDMSNVSLRAAEEFIARFTASIAPQLRYFARTTRENIDNQSMEILRCLQSSHIRSLRIPTVSVDDLRRLFEHNTFTQLEELEITEKPVNYGGIVPARSQFKWLLSVIANQTGQLRLLHLHIIHVAMEQNSLAAAIRGVVEANHPNLTHLVLYSSRITEFVKNILVDRLDPRWATIDRTCREQLGLGIGQVRFDRNILFKTLCEGYSENPILPKRLHSLWEACYPAERMTPLEHVAAFAVFTNFRLCSPEFDQLVSGLFEGAYSRLSPEMRGYPQALHGLIAMCSIRWFDRTKAISNGFFKRLGDLLLSLPIRDRLEYLYDRCVEMKAVVQDAIYTLKDRVIFSLIDSGHLGDSVPLDADQLAPKLTQTTGGVDILLKLLKCPKVMIGSINTSSPVVSTLEQSREQAE